MYIFALNMSELGLTDLVSHTINTGDNPHTAISQTNSICFT